MGNLEKLIGFMRYGSEGQTSSELSVATGVGMKALLSRLRQLVKDGQVVVGKRVATSVDGRQVRVPVYRKAVK